ncbi:MAG: tetratricopeptide repeat protein [Gemmatimonadota bacterium]|nr:tetratricopeptide repeat protein [Gemmatimonadota bacterium]
MSRFGRISLGIATLALAGFFGTPAACAMQAPDEATRLKNAESALRAGKHDDAIAALRDLTASPAATARARRAYVHALSEVGRYDEAESAARTGDSIELATPLGEVLYARGKLAAAESSLVRAVARGASDSLTALADLGVLRLDAGDRPAAMQIFDHFIDVYNTRRGKLTGAELAAVALACRWLGTEKPALYKDALKAYDLAIAADSGDLGPRVRLAELFLNRYNSPESKSTVMQVLRINASHPGALVAAARRAYFDSDTGAVNLIKRALATNPNYVSAHVFLAAFRADNEDWVDAIAEAKKALAINPSSREAMAALAAAQYLSHDRDAFEQTKRTALARNPHDGDFFAALAEASARNRLYAKAVEFAHEGAAVDPKSWRSLGLLGMNQLRIGQPDSARRSLDASFAGDPYDVWVKNTLDLLDAFKSYSETRTARFQFLLDSKESAVMSLYLGELGEEAFDKLVARYGYTPVTPVRLEVYRSHADFSVRTTGLAGLGALGVSFGNILAMDSPSARKIGEFNFGSTFWHELAHTFTLGATEHRVPRWFSEGLSVYEERRARPGWGASPTDAFLQAYAAKKLFPVSRLNDGFMHPAYPEQVIFSYYEASLVCEMIEKAYGANALVDMLGGYKNGLTTAQVIQRVLKSELPAFDAKFDNYMTTRFAGPLAAVTGPHAAEGGEFNMERDRGRALFEAKRDSEAIVAFDHAKKLFPEFVEGDSPSWYLAQLRARRGDLKGAMAELVSLTTRSETNYAANIMLDTLAERLGDTATAAGALERAIWISPFDVGTHVKLATLSAALGDHKRAVRERRAVVALDPTDKPEAYYQLALAYRAAGDAAAARREVLKALEAAPNFERAQDLLLALQGALKAGGSKP